MDYSVSKIKESIQEDLKNCLNTALRKGNINSIEREVKAVEQAQISGKTLSKDAEAEISTFCKYLKEEIQESYQEIMNDENTKQMQGFLRSEGLPSNAINTLISLGITTLSLLKQLKKPNSKSLDLVKEAFQGDWLELLKETLSGSRLESFVKEGKDKVEDDKCKKLEQKAQKTRKELDTLQRKIAEAAKQGKKKVDEDLQSEIRRVESQLNPFHLTLDLPSSDHLDSLKRQLDSHQTTMSQAQNDFRNQRELTLDKFFREKGVLKGFLLSSTGMKEKESCFELTVNINDHRDLEPFFISRSEFEMDHKSFSSASHFKQYQNWIKMGGRSWAAELKLKGGVLTPFSVSTGVQAGNRSEESKQEAHGHANFSYSETKNLFSLRGQIKIPRRKLKLIEEVLDSLKKVLDETHPQTKVDRLKQFLNAYGSHVMNSATFGGYYQYKASIEEENSSEKQDAKKAVSEKLDAQMSAAMKGAFISVAGSGAYSQDRTDGERKKTSSSEKSSRVLSELSTKGGIQNAPLTLWLNSLTFNSSWEIVDREVIPIWEIISENHESYFGARTKEIVKLVRWCWETEFIEKEASEREIAEKKIANELKKKKVKASDGTLTDLLTDHYYFIHSVSNFTKVIDGCNANDAWLGQWTKGETIDDGRQLWKLLPSKRSCFYFLSPKHGPERVMDGCNANDTFLETWPKDSTIDDGRQIWTLVKGGSGSYYLQPGHDSARVVEARDKNGLETHLIERGKLQQLWVFCDGEN